MRTTSIFIILAILLSAGCKHQTTKTLTTEIIGVRVTKAFPETISIPVHSIGTLASSEEVKLSFKTGGIIAAISVKEGDEVKKGAILATLNLSEIDAQVNQAENSYEKILRDYTRAKNLYRDSVATLEQLQNVTTAMNVAKSTMDIARFNLSHSKIIAPANGVILKQFVKTNEIVASGYPVFLFGVSGKNWKVKTGFSDRDIVKINIGDSATVTLDAYPGTKFSAAVTQVSEMSNPMTGTYDVELNLNDSDFRLASGFVAGVEIFPSVKATFFLVPVEAVVEADGQNGYIYTLTGSGTVQKLRIDIVTLTGSMVAVKGIPDGINEIVSEGAAYLRDGAKVKIVR